MRYLLLTRHCTPSNPNESGWQAYVTLEGAQERVTHLQRESKQHLVGGFVQVGPILLEHLILKVEDVT